MHGRERGNQNEVFRSGEGDAWFRRNKDYLRNFDPETDPPLRMLRDFGLRPSSALEVGAANGVRLAALGKEFGTEQLVAVEPSSEAISDGRARYPEIEFRCSVASELPEISVELVIVSFVLHWIDRGSLFKTVGEIDRVLETGGHLIITDFLPYSPVKTQYHHRHDEDVWTFKQDYSELLLASRLYSLESLIVAEHESHAPGSPADEQERIVTSLLRRRGAGAYPEVANG